MFMLRMTSNAATNVIWAEMVVKLLVICIYVNFPPLLYFLKFEITSFKFKLKEIGF